MDPQMNDHVLESDGRGIHRIDRLTQDRPPRRRWKMRAIVLTTLALAAVGLVISLRRPTVPEPMVYLPPGNTKVVAYHPADEGPTSVRGYEVTDVLERIRQSQPGVDADKLLLGICSAPTSAAAVRLEGGTLTTELTAKGHERLEQMLDAWREGGPQQIVVELRLIQAELALADSIDWADASVSNLYQHGSRPMVAARISDDQLREFMQDVQADAHSNILQAPKVTLWNGQTATITDHVERPFVTAVEPQEGGWLKPVIEVLQEGLAVTLRAATTGDGTIELTFDLQTSRIDEVSLANLPFRNPETPQGKVTVQVPSTSTVSVASTVRLPATQSLLIAVPQLFRSSSDAEASSATFYALTPRLLDSPEVGSEVAHVAASPLNVPPPNPH